MFGDIVDEIDGRWRDDLGVVHLLHATGSHSVADYWETLCGSAAWEEKRPRLTRRKVTCLMCLGLEWPEASPRR